MVEQRHAGYAVVAIVLIGLVLLATFSTPTLDSAESEWGEVTDRTSEIRTELVVTNSNFYPIPPVVTLQYDVSFNDIVVATGQRGGVGLSRGESSIGTAATMDNAQVAPWWRSHVERGEQTTTVVDPVASVPPIPITVGLPAQRTTIETDFAASLSRETVGPPVTFGEGDRVVLDDLSASWGEPTDARTPLVVSLTFRNRHDEPVVVENLRYRIGLNEIDVGAGPIEDDVTVPANGSETVDLTLAVENDRMSVWWPTHLRNDEQTRVVVELAGATRLVGTDDRSEFDVPIQNTTLETDTFG